MFGRLTFARASWAEAAASDATGRSITPKAEGIYSRKHFRRGCSDTTRSFRFTALICITSQRNNRSQIELFKRFNRTSETFFRTKDGWVDRSVKSGWMTKARRELNGGQLSINRSDLRDDGAV